MTDEIKDIVPTKFIFDNEEYIASYNLAMEYRRRHKNKILDLVFGQLKNIAARYVVDDDCYAIKMIITKVKVDHELS